jgi:tetratricopeptide (TPR) repeat protein
MTKRVVVLAAALVVFAFLLSLGWYGWRRYTAPVPPEVEVANDPDLVEAVEAARGKVRQNPHSADAWGDLGKLLRASSYHAQAVFCFAQAERLAPDVPRWAYLRGEGLLPDEPETALPHLRRAAVLCDRVDRDNIAPRLRLAELLLQVGRYDEAGEELRRAEEIDPDSPSVALDLGLLAYARDDLEASRTWLLRCQHSPFTRKRACTCLATIAQRLGHKAEATALSQRADRLPRDRAWPDPFVLECLQLAVGKPQRFRQVEALEAQGQLREAVALLNEMVERQPDAVAYAGLGKNLAALGDGRGAEEALRTAIHLAPDNAQAHYHLSKLLYARAEKRRSSGDAGGEACKDFESAAEQARLASASAPHNGLAHLILGLSLKALGRSKEALTALRTAVRCSPDVVEPHLYLGEALAESGQTTEARQHLEHASQLARPDDPRPGAALRRLRDRHP